MKQTRRKKKTKVPIFADLKQSLQEALAHERGKQGLLRVTEPPPKTLRQKQPSSLRTHQLHIYSGHISPITNHLLTGVKSGHDSRHIQASP